MSPSKEAALAAAHDLETVLKKHSLPFVLIVGLEEQESLAMIKTINHPDNFRGFRETLDRLISDAQAGEPSDKL
jgi:hypothetical protein